MIGAIEYILDFFVWVLRQANENVDRRDEERMNRAFAISSPSIITLCGSTMFKNAFMDANKVWTHKGWIVLSVGSFLHADKVPMTNEQKAELDVLHLRKIDLSDRVLVLNVGGYIGESTRKEIAYAESRGVYVVYLEYLDGKEWVPRP